MDFTDKLLEFISEAGKILHVDNGHDAIRQGLQKQLATAHRVDNPDGGYYDYPTVQDVFGDSESGQVVYSKNGKHTRADYKKGEDGGMALSKHTAVKRSYTAEAEVTESEVELLIEVTEAFLDKNGKGKIKLIGPGTGSTAHYTAESLKRTAANKVFAKGTHMHMDHQTVAERAARPEGSVKTMASTLSTDAEWEENGKDGPGLYAGIEAYPDVAPFLNARAKDIGMSVRGMIVPTGKTVNGKPEVQEFARAISVDYVTRAGAGGKPLMEVYESYRQETGGLAAKQTDKGVVIEMEVKESDFNALKAQADLVPALVRRLDRVEESNRRFAVRDIVAGLVQESKLPERAQTRISKPFLSVTFVPPVKDDVLDIPALTTLVKEAITEETTYLQESGVLRMSPVRKLGANGQPDVEPTEQQLSQEADISLQDITRRLSDLPKLERTA